MKFSDSGPMSDKEKKGHAKAILSKSQPKETEPDADDLEQGSSIDRMSIEPAEGGFTLETSHRPKPSKGDSGPEYHSPTKRVVGHDHPDAAHIRALIGKAKK